MSVKYFDKEKGEWLVFPGVKGESAYEAAKKGGFTGTEEEFNKKLANAGNVNITIDDNPTYGSKNVVSSGGVYNEIKKINDTIDNIDVSTQLGDYLTKIDADSKYEPLMNASKELFKVKSQDGSINPFTYGSTLDLSAIDVEVEVSDDYTVFAYHYSQNNPGAPSGGSVDTSYSILYPKDWYGSDKVDEWLNDDQELNIWMSYATFIVGGDIVGSWSYPIKVAKDGKDGQPGSKGEDGIDGATGAGIEFVYCRIAGKKITSFPLTTSKPDNSWEYDSPTGSWSDNPKGVNINNQTEWVCVRTKAEGSNSWGNWSDPALFSVFGEDGQDGGGFEYIFIRNNVSDFNQEANRPVGSQEDDSIPSGWSDNALTPTKDEPYVWVSTRKKSSTWGDFSIPTLWTWYVKDGQDGAKGEQGVAGAAGYTISTVYLYNRGNSTPKLPNVSLQYDIKNNELYLNSESWNDSVWSLSVPASTGESSLYRTEAFVKTNTPDEYITINSSQWSPVVVIAMDGSNGEDGTGESATQVTIDPDAMLLPVKSSGAPHLAYTFKFNTKFFYGTSEQTIVNYTKFKTDDENGVDLPNGIYSLSATYSENNVLYTAVIDINSTVVDPIIIPITLSANINDAEISKKNSISIVPTVQENPVIYTIEPNKNQFKIYDGINEYLKVKVYRIDGDVKTEATDVTLRYHYGDLNDDDAIDINDWIIYPEEGINIQNENADIFGREIILGIFNDGDNTPMLQNVVTLVYDGQKGDNGYDGASREYMFKLSNDKPSIVNDLGELDLTGWTDNPTGISEDNPKEWYITRNKPFMGEWNSWEEAGVMLWSSYGEKGNDGPGFEYIFTSTQTDDDIPEVPVVEQVDDFDSFTGDRKGWVDDVISPTEDNPIIWVSTRKKSIVNDNMIWSNFSEPKVWNTYVTDGLPGVDADSIGRIYVVGTEYEYVDRDPQVSILDGVFRFTEDNGVRWSYQECYNDIQNSDYWISHGYIYVWCLEYSYNIQQQKDPVLVNYYRMTPTIGAAGQTGKTIYPSGIYDTSVNYVATSTAAPYVYNQIDKKYYIYNHEEPWFDILGDKDVPTSLSGYENDWIPMEGFNAIYTEIGIIENGTVGDAVFNKGKMFSKDGAYYNGSAFVETTEDDGNYSLFGSYIDEANKTDDYYSNNHKFHPNTMIDFDSGKAVFGRGSVQLAKSSNDTSVFDSKVEVNNEFVVKSEEFDDVIWGGTISVDSNSSIISSYGGGQTGQKIGMLEITNSGVDVNGDTEIYIRAKDPRSDDVINSTVEGNDAIRSDYSRITLQEYINRCISNFLYGKTKDSYEILGISSYNLEIGSNSTETTSLNMSIDSAMGVSTGTYKWEGVVGSIMYNTQTCTTVDASDLKWNCTVAQIPASGINISISNSKLLNGSTVLNSGVLSISGSAPTSLFLNTINSVTGEAFNWTEATADIILSPTDSSFTQTISLKITK